MLAFHKRARAHGRAAAAPTQVNAAHLRGSRSGRLPGVHETRSLPGPPDVNLGEPGPRGPKASCSAEEVAILLKWGPECFTTQVLLITTQMHTEWHNGYTCMSVVSCLGQTSFRVSLEVVSTDSQGWRAYGS